MITAIFLDDGGVMNDNTRRGAEWRRLLPDFFIPRFGGTVAQWQEANVSAAEKLWKNDDKFIREKQDFAIFHETKKITWLKDMFTSVGIEPGKEVISVKIYDEIVEAITPRVDAAFPGIIAAIEKLSQKYQLFTASNESSDELRGYLSGMRIDDLFDGYYGADLIGDYKNSTYYYKKLSRLTKIKPENGIVVDDKRKNLEYAAEVGFHVIHSGMEGQEEGEFPYFEKAMQLPQLIEEIDKKS